MKVFVAENVLCDWECGLGVVCAENLDEAKKIIGKVTSKNLVSVAVKEVQNALRELSPNEAIVVWGGS